MVVAPVRVRVIEEVAPFGDVPLAPAAATGRSEAELARAIVEAIVKAPQPAERAPPLAARLAGVGALMRRGSHLGARVGARKRAA
jgi:hypothetical protein